MVVLKIVASRTVKPTIPPPYNFSVLHSCKLDLVIANIYVKTVYFFRFNGSSDFFSSHVLVQALSEALSHFYPLAGTITRDCDIECNGRGALFVEACADCSIHEFGDLKPDPKLLKLVPALDALQDITSQPLLMVQVTRFECGGVAFGVGLEHHAADGMSALSFLKAWSSIARGEPFTGSPSFDRAWLKARTPPTPQFVHDEYIKLPHPPSKEEMVKEESVVSMFDIPKELLQRLKKLGAGTLSTYELLAAHVWRCCCEARELRNDEESMLVMAVDGRTRLRGVTASESYVGNVIFNCCPILTVGDILQSDVMTTASKIRTAIKKMDDGYCRSAIDFLELCSPVELESFVKGAHTFASPNLGFISWTKFQFYEIDFGWGGATHVGPVHIPWEGHAYLMASPSSSDTGSLRLCITLQRRHMSKFAHLLLTIA